MKRPTKAQIKTQTATRQKLAAYVVSLGGTVLAEAADRTECTVPTAVGPLTLTLYNDWVAGRFTDDRVVLMDLGECLNRHSLKYNVQGYGEIANVLPEAYIQVVEGHVKRAATATIRDRNIEIRVGPESTTDIDEMPIVYSGSAAEWLARESEHWEDKGVVKTLVLFGTTQARRTEGRWFVALLSPTKTEGTL